MKLRLFGPLVMALTLAPMAPSFAAGGAFGGAYVFSSRSFNDDDWGVNGPVVYKRVVSANTLVQADLARLGYYHGPIDGNVEPGSRTARAIARYQRDHRLPVTGAIDGNVIASLSGMQ